MGDLMDYFSTLRKKYDEERRILQAESIVNGYIKEAIISYKSLLDTIDKKQLPEIHERLQQSIIKFETLIKDHDQKS